MAAGAAADGEAWHGDFEAGLGGGRPDAIKQMRLLRAEHAVVLGPHEQIDRAEPGLFGEEREDIALAVHHGHRAHAVQLRREGGALPQAAHPALRLAFLERTLGTLAAAVRSLVELRDAERQAVLVDGQGGMQVQPQGAGRAAILGDQAEADAAGMLGEVEIGAVLEAEHGGLVLHAFHGAAAVGGEDALGGNLAGGGLIEQAVVAADRGPVGVGGGREGSGGLGRLELGTLH